MLGVARMVFFVTALLTGLGSFVGVAVGAAYASGGNSKGWINLGLFIAVLVVLAFLVVRPAHVGASSLVVSGLLAVSGLGFAGFGAYWTAVDPGDIALWIWPLLMGLSLIVVAFARRPSA